MFLVSIACIFQALYDTYKKIKNRIRISRVMRVQQTVNFIVLRTVLSKSDEKCRSYKIFICVGTTGHFPLWSRCPKMAIAIAYSLGVILGASLASIPKIIKIGPKTKELWSFLSPPLLPLIFTEIVEKGKTPPLSESQFPSSCGPEK